MPPALFLSLSLSLLFSPGYFPLRQLVAIIISWQKVHINCFNGHCHHRLHRHQNRPLHLHIHVSSWPPIHLLHVPHFTHFSTLFEFINSMGLPPFLYLPTVSKTISLSNNIAFKSMKKININLSFVSCLSVALQNRQFQTDVYVQIGEKKWPHIHIEIVVVM